MTERFANLARDRRGAMAVEAAIVLPVLLLLGLGAAQGSKVVTKQAQMQAAVSQAEQMIAASPPTTSSDLDTIRTIIKASAAVTANPTVEFVYSCQATGTAAPTTTTTKGTCGTLAEWTYVHIRMTYTYTPAWTEFGFGAPVNLVVDRKALIG